MSETASLADVEAGEPLIEVEHMSKYFATESGFLASILGTDDVEAVDDVSFDIRKGETLALVGESGCGKSTLARAVLQLERPTAGTVRYRGTELTAMSSREIRPLRKEMQMIFQDPQSSLNPRMKVGPIIEEPMRAHDMHTAEGRRERARTLLEKVGLDASHYHRYPHEFSGGQRQRINLARALSTDPDLILCDEPVSALDVSVQSQVLNTMRDLQEEFGVTYLFISHDMSVVRYVADRVAVMYLGHIVELAAKEELFENPSHPYTRALLDAIPVPDPRTSDARGTLAGDVPSPVDPPSGCRFRTRCPRLIQPGTVDLDPAEMDDAVRESRLSTYGMSEAEWDAVRSFSRAVARRSFTLRDGRETDARDGSETDARDGMESDARDGRESDAAVSRSHVRERVDERFFADARPGGEPGDVIEASIDLLADGEWDEATTLLRSTFEEPSVCAVERPHYHVEPEHGSGEHFVACHLHRDE